MSRASSGSRAGSRGRRRRPPRAAVRRVPARPRGRALERPGARRVPPSDPWGSVEQDDGGRHREADVLRHPVGLREGSRAGAGGAAAGQGRPGRPPADTPVAPGLVRPGVRRPRPAGRRGRRPLARGPRATPSASTRSPRARGASSRSGWAASRPKRRPTAGPKGSAATGIPAPGWSASPTESPFRRFPAPRRYAIFRQWLAWVRSGPRFRRGGGASWRVRTFKSSINGSRR